MSDRNYSGILMTFEGIEGSGKTSQMKRAEQVLQHRGYDTMFTREPGGSIIGGHIRRILLDPDIAKGTDEEFDTLTELLLYIADRNQTYSQRIIPALESGKSVIVDRSRDSTSVYQGIARGMGFTLTDMLNDMSTSGISSYFRNPSSFDEYWKDAISPKIKALRSSSPSMIGESILFTLQNIELRDTDYSDIKIKETFDPLTELILFLAYENQVISNSKKEVNASDILHSRQMRDYDTEAKVIQDRMAGMLDTIAAYDTNSSLPDSIRRGDYPKTAVLPDITFLIDIDVEESFKRMNRQMQSSGREFGKTLDRIELEAEEFHYALRQGYLDVAARFPERIKIIDGMTPEGTSIDESVDIISSRIESHLTPLIESKRNSRYEKTGHQNSDILIPYDSSHSNQYATNR